LCEKSHFGDYKGPVAEPVIGIPLLVIYGVAEGVVSAVGVVVGLFVAVGIITALAVLVGVNVSVCVGVFDGVGVSVGGRKYSSASSNQSCGTASTGNSINARHASLTVSY